MSVRRFALSLLAAALGAGIIVAPPAPAFAQDNQRDASSETETLPNALEITATGTPVLVPDADIVLTYTITNHSDAALSISYLQFRSQSWVPTNIDTVASWLTGEAASYLVRGEEVDISVPAGQTITSTLRVDRDAVTWRAEEYAWGPRGVQIQVFTDTGETLSDRTMLIVAPDAELTPMPFTAVVPVTADPNSLGNSPSFLDLLTASEPTPPATNTQELDDAAPGSSDDAQRASVAERIDSWGFDGVSLFVDPALLADDDVTRSLRSTAADISALPLHDADIAAFAHSGIDSANAQQFLDDGLQDFETARISTGDNVFLPEDNVDTASLAYARDLGLTSSVIESSTIPEATPLFFTPHAHTAIDVEGEPLSVLVTDAMLTSVVSGELTYGDQQIQLSDLDRRQVALTVSAMSFRDLPNAVRASAVRLPRGEIYAADATAINETIRALTEAPWLEPATVGSILASDPESTERAPLPDSAPNFGEFTRADFDGVSEALADVANFAMIFDDSEEIIQAATTHARSLVGIGWRDYPNKREINIRGIAPNPRVQSAIRVESSSTINMISETSALPIQVTNPFEFPVNVLIDLDTPDSRLIAPEPVSVRLEGNSTTQVHVPVEAWGSGNIKVDVNVTNADGVPIGQSQEIDIRVRADWENWGTAIIALLFGIMLIVGVFKAVRKGRRSEPIKPDEFDAAVKASTNTSRGS